MLAGVSDPALIGVIEPLNTSVGGKLLPSFSHVELGMAQLACTFEDPKLAKQRFVSLPVSTSRQFEHEPRSLENKDFFDRFEDFLSKLTVHRELILISVHSGEHFCLLSVAGSRVRYFEGLSEG